jgi:hypothetical protein
VTWYAKGLQDELRPDGITFVPVKGPVATEIEPEEAGRIAQEIFVQMGFRRRLIPAGARLVQARRRTQRANKPLWDRLCYVAQAITPDFRSRQQKMKKPSHLRHAVIFIDAETGEVRFSTLREWSK